MENAPTNDPGKHHLSMVSSVSRKDQMVRLIGCTTWLPRKVRSLIVRTLTGDERALIGKSFEVPLYGLRYRGNTASHIDWHIFYMGEYDPVGTRFLSKVAQQISPRVFLDIGANTGTHTLAVVGHTQQVHCFEPYPVVLAALKENIELNQLEHVAVHGFGLSNDDRMAGFVTNKSGNLGAGTFELDGQPADFELPLKHGDPVISDLGLPSIDLVKIDVEGHESQILRGLRDSFDKYRPIVLWECIRRPMSPDEINELLPTAYETRRLRFHGRWNRNQPRLETLDCPACGNFVSFPREQQAVINRAAT